MSSYIDSEPRRDFHGEGADDGHSWGAFTEARLEWLYGRDQKVERWTATQADIAAWRRLGSQRRPAA